MEIMDSQNLGYDTLVAKATRRFICNFFFFNLKVPVNNFSVISGQVFLGCTSTKQPIMWTKLLWGIV